MVFEALVWKTSPGACEVDPPVSGSGPWSTTVTRSQPRAVSSSARFAPTMPAPMITTRGVVDMTALPTAGRSRGWGCSTERDVLEAGVEQPGGQVAGERRADQDGEPVLAEREQHDPGQAEGGLRAAPGGKRPRVQVDRAALGQHLAGAGAADPQPDPLRGDVDGGATDRAQLLAQLVLQQVRCGAGAGEQPLVGAEPDQPPVRRRRPGV